MKHFLLAVFGLCSLVVLGSPEGKPQDEAQAPDGDPAELLREAQNTLRVLNRISDALPRQPLEPDQLVEHVLGRGGKDAEELTQWVADSIGWLPYRGALRGPRGVLIERRGNSLDQSLLLAEALQVTGLEVRLARAQLPLETATELYAAVRPSGAPRVATTTPPAPRGGDELEAFARKTGLDPAQLRQASQALEIQGQRYLERVMPMAVRQTQDLKSLLAENGVTGPAEPEALEAAQVAALRDHWWVQASADGQAWQDHDPLAVRGGLAQALTPDTTSSLEELPADARHGLVLRIVAERLDSQGLAREVALTHTTDASTLAGGHFLLYFRSMNPELAGEPQPGEEESGASLLELAAAETEWLPVLVEVDYLGRPQEFHESSIYTDGTLNAEPQLDAKNRKVGDAISALSEADGESVARDSQLTALWIEYELTAPGRAPAVVRRHLFDLLGEARRGAGTPPALELEAGQLAQRGLALSGQTQILPETCRLSGDFVVRLDLATRLKNQRLMVELGQKLVDGEELDLGRVASSLTVPPLELFMLARMRHTLGRHAQRVHLGSVNVFANHLQPFEPRPDQAQELKAQGVDSVLIFARAVDIVANGVDVLAPPEDADDPAAAWDIRLEQGVLDTVLEVVSLADREERLGGGLRKKRDLAENPAMWMQEHPIEGWRAVKSGEELDGRGDTHARVAAALATGQVAVVPRDALGAAEPDQWAPGCWWSVDPQTGATLGMGPRGWGQETAEYTIIQRIQMKISTLTYQKIACFFLVTWARFVVGMATAQLGESIAPDAPWMSLVMAALSQAGATGAMWTAITATCQAVM